MTSPTYRNVDPISDGSQDLGIVGKEWGNLRAHHVFANGVEVIPANYDPAGAANSVQGNLTTHINANGPAVHGLGTASEYAATYFEVAGAANTVQGNLDAHANLTGTSVHGLGTASIANTGDFDAANTAANAIYNHVAASDPHTQYQNMAQKGNANGYASLDGNGKIPSTQVPAIAIMEFLGVAANQTQMLSFVGEQGDWCVRSDETKTYIMISGSGGNLSDWQVVYTPSGGTVLSVNGQTGVVVLGYVDVGADQAGAANTVANSLANHVALTTSAHGGIVASTDSRLTDSRTPTAHQLDGALHTVSGLTSGYVLTATGANTVAFQAPSANMANAVILAPTTSARNIIQPTLANVVPLAIRGAANQTSNLEEWQDDSGTVRSQISANGAISVFCTNNYGRTISIRPNPSDSGECQVVASSIMDLQFSTWMNIASSTGEKLKIDTEGGMLRFKDNFIIGDSAAGSASIATINAGTRITTTADNLLALRIRANSATQTANLTEWQNSSGAAVASMGPKTFTVGTGLASSDANVVAVFSNNVASPANLSGLVNYPFVFVGEDGKRCRLVLDNYANGVANAVPALTFRSAQGTSASPTATTSGDMLNIGLQGFGSTGRPANTKAVILASTTATWNDSAQPFHTTVLSGDGATGTVTRQRWYPTTTSGGGGVQLGGNNVMSATSPGDGIIHLSGATAVNMTVGALTLGTATKLTVNNSNAVDNSATVQFNTGSDTNKGLVVQRNSANQTANLVEYQSSTGGSLSAVHASGAHSINLGAGTLSGNIDARMITNGDTVLYMRRNTDSSPSGAFIQCMNAGGGTLAQIDSTGKITSSSLQANTGSALTIRGTLGGTTAGFDTLNSSAGATKTLTSGAAGQLQVTGSFSPASGTATWTTLELASTINQTGGANGITRGIHLNPTLTAAADYRAIEVGAGLFKVDAAGVTTTPRTILTETNAAGATPVDTDVSAWANGTMGIVKGTGGRIFQAYKNATDVYYVEMTAI